jgi:hypothetical protein
MESYIQLSPIQYGKVNIQAFMYDFLNVSGQIRLDRNILPCSRGFLPTEPRVNADVSANAGLESENSARKASFHFVWVLYSDVVRQNVSML